MKSQDKPLTAEDIIQIATQVQNDPRRFKRYANDPNGFVRDILGVKLWKKQKELLQAAVSHRAISCRSGHGTGKTVDVACLVIWWLYCREGLVITTAPTKEQMEDVLWREIGLRWRNARVPLPGECFKTSLKVEPGWYAVGITTDQPEAFRGRHHPNLLVVVDEANGVPETVHEEISTLTTGDANCRVMISNPTTMTGTFYESHNPHNKTWFKLHISCLDHPNVVTGKELIQGAVTRRWVEEARAKYGEQHPFWYSRVLGEFPKVSTKGVVPLLYIERAINTEKRDDALKQAVNDRAPRVGGLDVARYGENLCVLMIRRGDALEHIEAWSHASLMETAKKGLDAIKEWNLETLVVDASGIGAGVVDRLLEQHAPVLAYNGGHRAFTPASFSNRRSELWWAVRTRFERGLLWLPEKNEYIDKLVKDLIAPEYSLNTTGRIVVESKEKLLDRGIPSPDFADALIQCFAVDEDPTPQPEPLKDKRKDYETVEIFTGREDEFEQFPRGF